MSDSKLGDPCYWCGEPIEEPGPIICCVCGGECCRKCCPGGFDKVGDEFYSVKQCSSCTPDDFRRFMLSKLRGR